jgi:hypothetical protein
MRMRDMENTYLGIPCKSCQHRQSKNSRHIVRRSNPVIKSFDSQDTSNTCYQSHDHRCQGYQFTSRASWLVRYNRCSNDNRSGNLLSIAA